MTVLPSDVVLRQPAEIVIPDRRTSRDIDARLLAVPGDHRQAGLLPAKSVRAGRPGQVVARVFAFLSFVGAAFMIWCAATGYRL